MAKTKPAHKRFFAIDETVGLHQNRSFWTGVLVPIFISMLIIIYWSIELYQKGELVISLSQEATSQFLKYFAFPISLLSISLVFGVMVARFHASKQKAKSNQITEQNNVTNTYFTTLKYFDEYTSKLTIQGSSALVTDYATCYKFLFKDNDTAHVSMQVHDESIAYICQMMTRLKVSFVDYIYKHDFVDVSGEARLGGYGFSQAAEFDTTFTADLEEQTGLSLKVGFMWEAKDIFKELDLLQDSFIKVLGFPGIESRETIIDKLKLHLGELKNQINEKDTFKELSNKKDV